MPIYEYQCVDCTATDRRVAGLDDHTALCAKCGGLMLRLDEDVFGPYAVEAEPLCDLLCRKNCEWYDPESPLCQEQVVEGES
ncbi:MAG: FmdB family zinc ribbon protein [Desulfobaccales bacterium]